MWFFTVNNTSAEGESTPLFRNSKMYIYFFMLKLYIFPEHDLYSNR